MEKSSKIISVPPWQLGTLEYSRNCNFARGTIQTLRNQDFDISSKLYINLSKNANIVTNTLSDQSSNNIFVTCFLTDKTSLFLKDGISKRRIKYLQLLLKIHASFETGIGKPDHSVSPGRGRQLSDSSKVAG